MSNKYPASDYSTYDMAAIISDVEGHADLLLEIISDTIEPTSNVLPLWTDIFEAQPRIDTLTQRIFLPPVFQPGKDWTDVITRQTEIGLVTAELGRILYWDGSCIIDAARMLSDWRLYVETPSLTFN